METKICKKCKHYRRGIIGRMCVIRLKKRQYETDVVSGRLEGVNNNYMEESCYVQRGSKGDCGPEGKLWEPQTLLDKIVIFLN